MHSYDQQLDEGFIKPVDVLRGNVLLLDGMVNAKLASDDWVDNQLSQRKTEDLELWYSLTNLSSIRVRIRKVLQARGNDLSNLFDSGGPDLFDMSSEDDTTPDTLIQALPGQVIDLEDL